MTLITGIPIQDLPTNILNIINKKTFLGGDFGFDRFRLFVESEFGGTEISAEHDPDRVSENQQWIGQLR